MDDEDLSKASYDELVDDVLKLWHDNEITWEEARAQINALGARRDKTAAAERQRRVA